jgi:hypothetical protein
MTKRISRVLFAIIVATIISKATARTSNLQDWIKARCGSSGHAIWSFQGALYDPLNGNKIANVQGLELVRCLAETSNDEMGKSRFQRRCGDLMAPAIVAKPTSNFTYAGTLLSRKLFCYTSDEGPKKLLDKVQLRPNSPTREIPADQAATVYDTASTFIQRGREWIAHTEWPDGRAVCTTTKITSDTAPAPATTNQQDWRINNNKRNTNAPSTLEFTSYARPQPRGRNRLPDLSSPYLEETTTSKSTIFNSLKSAVVASPKRSAIIQFGASQAEQIGKFGARETYHYRMDGDDCTVRYTRYGEGPIWYGPGRLCTLELTGKRISNMAELPPLVAKVAAERVLGFLSVRSAVAQDDSLASRAVEWFRGKGNSAVQIAPSSNDKQKAAWLQRVESGGSTVWNKVRSATSFSVGGE